LLIVVPAVVPAASAGLANPIVALAITSGKTCANRTLLIVQTVWSVLTSNPCN
jgi:hypothetical protein